MMIPRDITNNNTTTTTTTDGVVPVVVAAVAAAINDDSVIDNDDNDNDDDSDDRDNNNNAPAAIVRREERLLTLLDSTKAPPSFVDQQDYENRLLTYRAMTYYAKPSCLSPLFCARFGWRNVDRDMLECTGCGAVLAITLNTKLSNQSYEKLCNAYRDRIVSCHNPTCRFRLTNQEFQRILTATAKVDHNTLNTATNSTTTMTRNNMMYVVVPPYMASVLPEESVRLLGHPQPSTILRNRVKQLIDILHPSKTTTTARGTFWRYPKLVIPTEIQQLVTNYSVVTTKLFGLDDDNISHNSYYHMGSHHRRESIAALAILGWTPIERLMVDSVPTVTLGCPLCLSVMELRLKIERQEGPLHGEGDHEEDDDDDDDENDARQHTTKRLRQLSRYCNPLDAHRHYCPYKSGFPTTSMDRPTPVWQVITHRLQQEEATMPQPAGHFGNRKDAGGGHLQTPMATTTTTTTTHDDDNEGIIAGSLLDASIDRVRKILQAGIAPREVDLGMP